MIGEHWADPYPELELADRLKAADRDNRWESFGKIEVYANSGMWVADCPRVGCGGAEHLGPHPDSHFVGGLTDELFRCSRCFAEAESVWPKQRQTIERILAERPYSQHRNWIPGVSIQDLEAANETPWHFSWTTPKTFTAGSVLTAAELNTHLRDNLLETGPAKVSGVGRILVSTAANTLAGRLLASDAVITSETTTSTSYTDLATSGPSVTVDTNVSAVCWFASQMSNSSTDGTFVSIDVSGASTIAPSDTRALEWRPSTNDFAWAGGYGYIIGGLTAGSNTFKMEYRVSAGTGEFSRRRIAIMPL